MATAERNASTRNSRPAASNCRHGRHSATKPPGKLTTHRTAALGPMFCGETMGQGVKRWHFMDPGVPGPAPRTRTRTQPSRADQRITRVRDPAPTQRPSPTAFERSPPPPRPTKPACVRPRWRGVQPLAARFDPPWRDRVSRPLAVGQPQLLRGPLWLCQSLGQVTHLPFTIYPPASLPPCLSTPLPLYPPASLPPCLSAPPTSLPPPCLSVRPASLPPAALSACPPASLPLVCLLASCLYRTHKRAMAGPN